MLHFFLVQEVLLDLANVFNVALLGVEITTLISEGQNLFEQDSRDRNVETCEC